MTSKNGLVVWAHPRIDSLTATIAADLIDELTAQGFSADVIDLYRDGFDPLVRETDEPDWDDLDKQYSPEVVQLAQRTMAADAVLFVFPVWWYDVPAIMKGFIDRVFNNGLFYGGGRRSGISAARWIGLAGESAAGFRKREYDEMMARHLNIGIAGLCEIDDSSLLLLHGTLGDGIDDFEAHVSDLRARARAVAGDLAVTLA